MAAALPGHEEWSQKWGLPLTQDALVGACQACEVCALEYPHPQCPGVQMARSRGRAPLTPWQVDYTGPLLRSEGAMFALTAVDMATGLLFSWPYGQESQRAVIGALRVLTALYGQSITMESDRGTHCTGQNAQQWQLSHRFSGG